MTPFCLFLFLLAFTIYLFIYFQKAVNCQSLIVMSNITFSCSVLPLEVHALAVRLMEMKRAQITPSAFLLDYRHVLRCRFPTDSSGCSIRCLHL